MTLEDLLLLPTRFTAEQYLAWTRVQCLAWTAADVCIVVLLLRTANMARARAGKRPHVFSYAVLAATLLFVPLILIVRDGWTMFFVELAITVPHFLLILYVGTLNLRLYPALLADILTRQAKSMGDKELGQAR